MIDNINSLTNSPSLLAIQHIRLLTKSEILKKVTSAIDLNHKYGLSV